MTTGPRLKVAERIAGRLRQSIVEGKLRPGDALPSERDLADRYDVNRSSIREAMKRLEAWGLVKIRQGGATRVADFVLSAGMDLIPYLVEAGGKVDEDIVRDLHDIRAMLLGWCAEQAAKKADPSSIARLDELAHRLADSRAKPALLQELDYDFFQELIAISGNRLLALFANVVREVYSKGKERFVSMYAPNVFDARRHQRVVDAIRARDAATAGTEMRAHAAGALRTLEAPRKVAAP